MEKQVIRGETIIKRIYQQYFQSNTYVVLCVIFYYDFSINRKYLIISTNITQLMVISMLNSYYLTIYVLGERIPIVNAIHNNRISSVIPNHGRILYC